MGGAPYLKRFSIIFVYSNESAKSPTQVAPLDETFTSSKRGYFRVLQVAGEKFIPSHHETNAPELDPLPKALDHDGTQGGIDDGIFEKGSSVHYFDNGKWLILAGSNQVRQILSRGVRLWRCTENETIHR